MPTPHRKLYLWWLRRQLRLTCEVAAAFRREGQDLARQSRDAYYCAGVAEQDATALRQTIARLKTQTAPPSNTEWNLPA